MVYALFPYLYPHFPLHDFFIALFFFPLTLLLKVSINFVYLMESAGLIRLREGWVAKSLISGLTRVSISYSCSYVLCYNYRQRLYLNKLSSSFFFLEIVKC